MKKIIIHVGDVSVGCEATLSEPYFRIHIYQMFSPEGNYSKRIATEFEMGGVLSLTKQDYFALRDAMLAECKEDKECSDWVEDDKFLIYHHGHIVDLRFCLFEIEDRYGGPVFLLEIAGYKETLSDDTNRMWCSISAE